MCDNKFSNIAKAVILLASTEVYACLAASNTHKHTHTGYHLQAISQAIPSKERLFLPLPSPPKSDTALIISSLAYQLSGKKMQLLNC